jgi:hypothetical protein
MKTLINITILSILFCKFSFPQFYADSVLADEVVEFVNIANDKTINFSIYNRPKIDFTDDELEHLLALYYKCYSIYTVCFNDYMAEEHKKWEKASLNVTTGEMKLRPWMRVYSLVNQLSNKFRHKFISIIGIPAFMRGKFIELNFSTYILKDTNTKFRVHNFSFEVEEVLKGDKYFQPGDTISIDMIPNVESPAPSFITGKSYLIPVTTLLGHQDDGFNTIFSYLTDQRSGWEMGKLPTTFPIENDIIKNCEYFGIKDTNWTAFKKYFTDTYLIFE